jgi:hypothetical protein
MVAHRLICPGRPPPGPNRRKPRRRQATWRKLSAPHERDGAAVLERWLSRTCAGRIVAVATDARMIALGFRKYARADRIFALEPLLGEERGDGRRTKVWVEGVADPIIASRTERAILRDMGQETAADASLVDEALDLASRLAQAAEVGRVDLNDLGRRARRLLAATTAPE